MIADLLDAALRVPIAVYALTILLALAFGLTAMVVANLEDPPPSSASAHRAGEARAHASSGRARVRRVDRPRSSLARGRSALSEREEFLRSVREWRR